MIKLISILGSTGSVGLTTCKIIDKDSKNFKPYLFSANKNYSLICKQITKYKPNFFVVKNKKTYLKLKKKFQDKKTKILNNFDSIKLKKKSDITICAIPGIAGLKPTIIFTNLSKKILLANKESIICGWDLIKNIANKSKTTIVPIDSEHYSISNLIKNHRSIEINKIYLTASGGPFLNYNYDKLKEVKPYEALRHPKWKMGKKISIDSSTLMNKILELIEAQKLFNIPQKKLEIVIHPQSLVHAIIELKNGLHKFIYHHNSMIIPIANAIFGDKLLIDEIYPEHYKKNVFLNNFSFQKVDKKKFPIIKIKNRLNEHKSTAIIINAVNETLVDLFLQKKVAFFDIFRTILRVLNDRNYKKYAVKDPKSINEIFLIDKWARDISIKKI